MLTALTKMADVMHRRYGFDLEGRLARHIEGLAANVLRPTVSTGQFDPAVAVNQLHDFGRTGVEGECGWQDDADTFFAAIGQNQAVRDAFAIKVNIGAGLNLTVEGVDGRGVVGRHVRQIGVRVKQSV